MGGSEEGPTVEDLANLAAQVTEVPRGSQRLIFKGTAHILCNMFVCLVINFTTRRRDSLI